MSIVVLAAAVASGTVLLAFVAYLALCAFVVVRTNDTAGLRDLAVAIRAFRGVLAVRGKS